MFSIAKVAVTGLSDIHSAVDISRFFVINIAVLLVTRKGRERPSGLAGLTCQINSVDFAYLLEIALLE